MNVSMSARRTESGLEEAALPAMDLRICCRLAPGSPPLVDLGVSPEAWRLYGPEPAAFGVYVFGVQVVAAGTVGVDISPAKDDQSEVKAQYIRAVARVIKTEKALFTLARGPGRARFQPPVELTYLFVTDELARRPITGDWTAVVAGLTEVQLEQLRIARAQDPAAASVSFWVRDTVTGPST